MSQGHEEIINILKQRFETHMKRHAQMDWQAIQKKLEVSPEKCRPLVEMERTGGEPDVIGYDAAAQAYIFCDCSAESPAGRRSLCYDQKALDSRKENKPAGSAMGLAAQIGIEMLNETQYRELQNLVECDKKTSSWIVAPDSVRDLGGGLFGDRRYDRVFVYHNGAESYYAARGFRGRLLV